MGKSRVSRTEYRTLLKANTQILKELGRQGNHKRGPLDSFMAPPSLKGIRRGVQLKEVDAIERIVSSSFRQRQATQKKIIGKNSRREGKI